MLNQPFRFVVLLLARAHDFGLDIFRELLDRVVGLDLLFYQVRWENIRIFKENVQMLSVFILQTFCRQI
jgi:hypothetical protein